MPSPQGQSLVPQVQCTRQLTGHKRPLIFAVGTNEADVREVVRSIGWGSVLPIAAGTPQVRAIRPAKVWEALAPSANWAITQCSDRSLPVGRLLRDRYSFRSTAAAASAVGARLLERRPSG